MPVHEDALTRFKNDEHKNVFIIMRYGDDEDYRYIERTIKASLAKFGFKGVLAKDKRFRPQLWENIELCMRHSRYAVVLFEQNPRQPEFNPNVSVELGFMMALNKECLILKERELAHLPTDILGHLYTEFRRSHLELDIEDAVRSWLEGLNHVQTVETICHTDATESNKIRTARIIDILASFGSDQGEITRQAGSLSSLAISSKEKLAENNSDLKTLLLEEKRQFLRAIERGITVRLIICPDLQKVAVDLNLISPERVRSHVICRIDEMISLLGKYGRKENLQAVYVARLPHDNVLIVGDQMFIGRRRLHEWGFPSTSVIRDQDLLRTEVEQFDLLFDDAVRAILRISPGSPSRPHYGSPELKQAVRNHLISCRADLERRIRASSPTESTDAHSRRPPKRTRSPKLKRKAASQS